MDKIEFTVDDISTRLCKVAEALKPPAKDTILLENYGKHLFEIDLILQNLGKGGRILDVGGGVGVNLLCIQELVEQGLELYLIDKFEEYTAENKMGPSDRALKLMELSNICVINQDFWLNTKLPFESEFFDLITIFGVIEHLPGHPLRLLKETKRILKQNGQIILCGPNAVSLVKKTKLLLGMHPYIPFNLWIADRYYSHYREYSREEYRLLLEVSGFKHVHTIMSAEPSRTRARNRYRKGKHAVLSPMTMILYGLYILDILLPRLRPAVYCIGKKL